MSKILLKVPRDTAISSAQSMSYKSLIKDRPEMTEMYGSRIASFSKKEQVGFVLLSQKTSTDALGCRVRILFNAAI